MNINHPVLTKTQLYDTIISMMSANQLNYNFLKSNKGYYYFKRPAGYEGVTDQLVIKAHLKNGFMVCKLESCMFKPAMPAYSLSSGLLNRYIFLFNSQSASPFGPAIWSYFFQNDLYSLASALTLLLSDLNVDGKEFVTGCDNRYSNPRFLLGMEYIRSLTVSRETIKPLLYTTHGRNWTVDHIKFHELTHLFDEIDKSNDVDERHIFHGRFKSNYSNNVYAFEFFVKYAFEEL